MHLRLSDCLGDVIIYIWWCHQTFKQFANNSDFICLTLRFSYNVMFETNLTANRTRKLELLNLKRHGIARMGHWSDNKYTVYKFLEGKTFVFQIFNTKRLSNLLKILQKRQIVEQKLTFFNTGSVASHY